MHSSLEALTVETPRSLHGVIGPLLGIALWSLALNWIGVDDFSLTATVGLGLVVVPALVFNLIRLTRPHRLVLERKGGLVWVGPDPLETARVEMRATHGLFLLRPRAYRLSLWALTLEGRPLSHDLGEHRSMVQASEAAGVVDEFLHRKERRPLLASK